MSSIDPAASVTGPVTFAQRREMMQIAIKAIQTLQQRDRQIVRLGPEADIVEIADQLGLSHEAAQKARHRALLRFEKSFRVLSSTQVDGKES